MARIRRYLAESIRNTASVDYIALLSNPPTQVEYFLPSQEQGADVIGLHVNTNKIEYMIFKQDGVLSPENGVL